MSTSIAAAHVGVAEAKAHLANLLDRVERGEDIIITRHGKPVARLVREPPTVDMNHRRKAVDGLEAISKDLEADGVWFEPGEIRAMIEEDRC